MAPVPNPHLPAPVPHPHLPAPACSCPSASPIPQVLDHFMTEVGQRFSTRTEERLLAVVYTLQQRTYKTGLPAGAPVPDMFKKELSGGRRWGGVAWLCRMRAV